MLDANTMEGIKARADRDSRMLDDGVPVEGLNLLFVFHQAVVDRARLLEAMRPQQ